MTTAILSLLLGLGAADLLAWGDDGHQIVGEIAWNYLTPSARRAVRDLLPPGDFSTLYLAATWPDRYARNDPRYKWVTPLHYIDVEITNKTVALTSQNCGKRKCIIAAIQDFSKQLRAPDTEEWKRINALRLVAHFVGDIHQPLHVAHRDNCGGCTVKPAFAAVKFRTIHKIWDSTLIDQYLEVYASQDGNDWSSDYDSELWEEFAYDLRSSITIQERESWTSSLKPLDWAQESLEIAQYDIFRYSSSDTLPPDYADKAYPIITKRLKQAGVRLAELLNVVFSDRELPF